MNAETERILEVFRRRGIRPRGFVDVGDFGEAISWKDGFIRDEPVRQAFETLIEEGYVVEMNAGLQLTELGEKHLYGAVPVIGRSA